MGRVMGRQSTAAPPPSAAAPSTSAAAAAPSAAVEDRGLQRQKGYALLLKKQMLAVTAP